MTRKEQIKILDNKIESNINQYKINSLNAEILIKLLKDIRDSLACNVIIPARPPRPNDDGNDDGDDDGDDDGENGDNGDDGDDRDNEDDNGDDNGDDKTSFIDLSWINDLQLYKKIASEVFSRYNGDKDSFELFALRTFKKEC